MTNAHTEPNNRKNTALLIVDMQKGVVNQAYNIAEVTNNIKNLIDKARAEKASIIWVQHSDDNMKISSEAWELVSDLIPQTSDTVIQKCYGDSFESTNLESELSRLDIKRLIVVGAQSEACIRATIHSAFFRGYETVLVSDAHTTEDLTSYGLPAPETIISFTNKYWAWQSAPNRQGLVIKTSDVKFK